MGHHILRRCRGQGAEGNVVPKPEWVTMRDIGLKMCRNPGFFTSPIQPICQDSVVSAGEFEWD